MESSDGDETQISDEEELYEFDNLRRNLPHEFSPSKVSITSSKLSEEIVDFTTNQIFPDSDDNINRSPFNRSPNHNDQQVTTEIDNNTDPSAETPQMELVRAGFEHKMSEVSVTYFREKDLEFIHQIDPKIIKYLQSWYRSITEPNIVRLPL